MASTQASQGAGMRAPSLKWTEEEIQLIVNWLSFRDVDGKAVNWLLYQKGNKTDACRQLLEETRLIKKSGVSKQKTRDKIANMVALYKKWRDKADTTGWGLDVSNHDQVGDNIYGKTIGEVLLLKCSFYYDFEEIMGDSPTINPPFLMESGHPNREAEVRENSLSDLDTQQYNRWIDEDGKVDKPSEKEKSPALYPREKLWSPTSVDEDFLPSPLSPKNQALTITDDEESDDDLDLPPTKHLLSGAVSAKTYPTKKVTPQHAPVNITKTPKPSRSSHLQKSSSAAPNSGLISVPPQLNKRRKRRAKSPINVESDSGNERSSHRKRQNMAEAVVERKKKLMRKFNRGIKNYGLHKRINQKKTHKGVMSYIFLSLKIDVLG